MTQQELLALSSREYLLYELSVICNELTKTPEEAERMMRAVRALLAS